MRTAFSLLFFSLVAPTPAWPWSDVGHEKIAAAAYDQMDSEARTRASRLLQLNPWYERWVGRVGSDPKQIFMIAATWPDEIKSEPDYVRDAPSSPHRHFSFDDKLVHDFWHYINVPFTQSGQPVEGPAEDNIVTRLLLLRAQLQNGAELEQSFALTWMIHLIADVHQPLHAAARFTDAGTDRGGNRLNVLGPSRDPVTLHLFWDKLLDGENLQPNTSVVCSHFEPLSWAMESFVVAQNSVYPIARRSG